MRVLVTGASGFLGGHVTEVLREHGHEVRVLVRATSAQDHLAPGVERLVGSLEDEASLASAVQDVDAIVHAAGLTKARSEDDFRRVNVEGTRRLVEAARRNAKALRRFVQVSSAAAGSPTATPEPRDPGTPDQPVTRYGRSKLAGERVALEAAAELPVTVLRPPALYGPRDRESFPLYRAARLGFRVGVSGGVTHASLLHARDCADAIVALVERDHAPGRVYPVDDGGIHAVADVVRAIAAEVRPRTIPIRVPFAVLAPIAGLGELVSRLTGRTMLVDRDKLAEFAGPCWVVGHAAITRDLGWQPTIPLSEGIPETARWYREAGWL